MFVTREHSMSGRGIIFIVIEEEEMTHDTFHKVWKRRRNTQVLMQQIKIELWKVKSSIFAPCKLSKE